MKDNKTIADTYGDGKVFFDTPRIKELRTIALDCFLDRFKNISTKCEKTEHEVIFDDNEHAIAFNIFQVGLNYRVELYFYKLKNKFKAKPKFIEIIYDEFHIDTTDAIAMNKFNKMSIELLSHIINKDKKFQEIKQKIL